MSIIEELVFKAIRCGGEAVEVEYKDGYDEIFPLSGPSGVSLGIRLESSSKKAKLLRAELYDIAKKRSASPTVVTNTNSAVECMTVSVKTPFAWNGDR